MKVLCLLVLIVSITTSSPLYAESPQEVEFELEFQNSETPKLRVHLTYETQAIEEAFRSLSDVKAELFCTGAVTTREMSIRMDRGHESSVWFDLPANMDFVQGKVKVTAKAASGREVLLGMQEIYFVRENGALRQVSFQAFQNAIKSVSRTAEMDRGTESRQPQGATGKRCGEGVSCLVRMPIQGGAQ